MSRRLLLDAKLKALFGSSVTVYFQPPSGMEISIPACIYTMTSDQVRYADGLKYLRRERYTVKLIVTTLSEPFIEILLNHRDFSFETMYPTGSNQYNYLFRTTI